MATKKKTEETEVKATETASVETREEELKKALEAERKKNAELLKEAEALKAEADEYRTNDLDTEGTHDEAYWNERIYYTVPYFGDDEDTTVTVNGERIQVMRGETVYIKRKHALVLENEKKQILYSKRYNQSLQDDFERDTEKYIGEK